MNLPQLDPVEAALAKLTAKLQTVECESVATLQAMGRILSEPLLADRHSPPYDVSAMDGYAICLEDLVGWPDPVRLPITGIAFAGRAPIDLAPQSAVQIFTGGCVPTRASCVVRREDTHEQQDWVELNVPLESLRNGQNIRYQGENIKAGQPVLATGSEIDPATISSLATFGLASVQVRRQIQVSLLNSGDELVEAGRAAQPWQIRDSNGPTLRSWLGRLAWVKVVDQARLVDSLDEVKNSLRRSLDRSDLLVITGGVSAGDTDFIPAAIAELGGEIIFHRLPIRPGKPVLGAILDGKPILGLPGNPVSTAVTARVFGQPILDHMAGRSPRRELRMRVENPDDKVLPLTNFRLAQFAGESVRLVGSRGSGDLVSMAQSDGFVEIPAGQSGSGPWKFWLW